MIVGFTITDFKGHEQDAVRFIQEHTILRSPAIAENIVAVGPGINVYTRNVTAELLSQQPFDAELIEVREGKRLLISAVDFHIEIQNAGIVHKLSPTEYLEINEDEGALYQPFVDSGHVCMLPEYAKKGNGYWILKSSLWDDGGIWIDTDIWND